jgi:hypothetical protein
MALGGVLEARLAPALLEMILPLAVAFGVAWLPATEPAAELHHSCPRSLRGTLTLRVQIVMVSGALLGVLAAAALSGSGAARAPAAGLYAALGFAQMQLVWLAPMLALCAVAALVVAISGSERAAGVVVAALWIVCGALKDWFLARPALRPLYPFLTTMSDARHVSAWETNRLALIVTGAALLSLAWAVAGRCGLLLRAAEN